MPRIIKRLQSLFAKPGANFFLIAAAWGVAAIPCLCPACLAGPAVFLGRGVMEKLPLLKKLIS